MTPFTYTGSELEIFSKAVNWKNYYSQLIRPHLGDHVLEVGAGMGTSTTFLCRVRHQSWTCLEPDSQLANEIGTAIIQRRLPDCCQVRTGTIQDLNPKETFDSILYLDVLEHIETDRLELERASQHLNPGGRLIVLAPAHQWLFSTFDQAIGHFRRYSKSSLTVLTPPTTTLVQIRYLDSVGLLASTANRFFLKSSTPTVQQIALWDQGMVPLSKLIDPWLNYSIGKSVLAIWQKI